MEIVLDFELPSPWLGKRFKTSRLGDITFLVGPNGSGKSRFAEALLDKLPDSRLIGTDRLTGLETKADIFSNPYEGGFAKNLFDRFKAGREWKAARALVRLEERPDLRVRIEAILEQLFHRRLLLDWNSGNLAPMVTLSGNPGSYRFHRDECHGLKELVVLLTHLYDDEGKCLIVDEPELNLHPQYQLFLMQEIRKFAGIPNVPGKKLIVLITHSPFILDLQYLSDLQSVVCFDSKFSVPKHLFDLSDDEMRVFLDVLPRLNAHHKQLFFADEPVFVEGIHDARVVTGIQRRRGVSMEAAGSCLIDAGGNDEVTKYQKLCDSFRKRHIFFTIWTACFQGP